MNKSTKIASRLAEATSASSLQCGCQTSGVAVLGMQTWTSPRPGRASTAVYRGIRLRTGDLVEDDTLGASPTRPSEVNGIYTVDSAGEVNLPQIGAIRALGSTQQELQAVIELGYREGGVYSKPTISVSVSLPEARFVNVGAKCGCPRGFLTRRI